MKVLALNSSARTGGQSKTELLLTPFVKGMRDAGAEVEVVNLKQKKINYCIGCYSCWTKTPGICVQKDDMTTELFPKFIKSDIVVYATPLFHYQVNAQMKAFIERTLPVLMPYLQRKGDVTVHPLRHKHPAVVFISVAGFPDVSVFDALSFWANKAFGKSGALLAEIYRPAAESITEAGRRSDILAAMEQAGAEIVKNRSVSKKTMDRIMQPLGSPDLFAAMGNLAWQTMIDRKVTPREASGQDIHMRPDSIEMLMAMLSFAFNPQKASGKTGTLQFNLSGEHPGDCYFTISDGNITASQGKAEKATCVVDAPFEVWADIIEGKVEGAKMAMEGKFKVQGDVPLMMVFGND